MSTCQNFAVYLETPQKVALERERSKDNDDDYLAVVEERIKWMFVTVTTHFALELQCFFVLAGRAQAQCSEIGGPPLTLSTARVLKCPRFWLVGGAFRALGADLTAEAH